MPQSTGLPFSIFQKEKDPFLNLPKGEGWRRSFKKIHRPRKGPEEARPRKPAEEAQKCGLALLNASSTLRSDHAFKCIFHCTEPSHLLNAFQEAQGRKRRRSLEVQERARGPEKGQKPRKGEDKARKAVEEAREPRRGPEPQNRPGTQKTQKP